MKIVIGFISILMVITAITAQASDWQQQKDYLVQQIRTSGCDFYRNGLRHTPDEAADHILLKYGVMQDVIHSIDDFIDKAATRSSVTGISYTIKCPDQPEQETAAWLRSKLPNAKP